jgi:putative transposase
MYTIPRFDPERHHRRSIRLRGYDHANPGIYFVTFCTTERVQWTGSIVEGNMVLNTIGHLAVMYWLAIPEHHGHARIGAFVIVPDHIHCIIELTTQPSPRGVQQAQRPAGPSSGSIGAIVGSYRAGVTRAINRTRSRRSVGLWQRGYYDVIVRNDRALFHMEGYIHRHPAMVVPFHGAT